MLAMSLQSTALSMHVPDSHRNGGRRRTVLQAAGLLASIEPLVATPALEVPVAVTNG